MRMEEEQFFANRGAARKETPATKSVCASRLLPLLVLLLLTRPAVAQAQFNYTTNNGTITITGYTGPGGAVTIPDTINGLPVTSIGSFAFIYNNGLTAVAIPNSVTNIGSSAFYGCTSLTSVTIPNSVTSIGASAFDSCTSLTSVTIPNSVTSIGDWAFAFCQSLTAFTVASLNSMFSSKDGVLFNHSHTTLIQYPGGADGNYTIPNSVTVIGNKAFYGCISLRNITIPDSVKGIGYSAFSFCVNMTAVTISNSVTNIGNGAFHGCTSLTSITIPNSVTSIGDGAFAYCTSLASVTIANSVTSIGGHAFYTCTGLTSVTIPNSVASIGDWAFAECGALIGAFFQGNAPSQGSYIFFNDSHALVYYLPGTTGWGTTFGFRPTALWPLPNPLILNSGDSFGVQTNRFGFIMSWSRKVPVVVEACTNLANPIWSPLRTNTLTGGSSYFSDPEWTNYPARFYRIRSL